MKHLVISDIHGRHEILQTGLEKFAEGGYEKVVLLGDLADSYDRTNEDILRCFKLAFDAKEKYGDALEWLLGNHELSYMFPFQMCSGFRPELAATLNPWMVENRALFKAAYQHRNYLFTHAGVTKAWFKKYRETVYKFEEITGSRKLADSLNAMLLTGEGVDKLCEIGMSRGGIRYDYGGPFWADREDHMRYGPVTGYNQVVGHTPCKFIERIVKFEGRQHNNTSVTFCDVLRDGKEPKFLTLDI